MGVNATRMFDQGTEENGHRLQSSTNPGDVEEDRDLSDHNHPITNLAEEEQTKAERFKNVVKKDMDYLIGNLEKLPESAHRLFSMAKFYLTPDSSEGNSDAEFTSLFPVLPDAAACSTQEETAKSLKCGENLFVPLKKSTPLHYAQTYIQWKSVQDFKNLYGLCLPKRRTVYLQPLDEFPAFILDFRLKTSHLSLNLFELLQGFIQIYFSGFEVLIRPQLSLESSRLSVRCRYHESTNKKQYCVNDLYPLLQSILPADGLCIVGIIWTDIFPEGYNFVLGEASVKHQAAVISFGRFEPSSFDQDTSMDIAAVDGVVMWKLLKSLSHELCHIFGLEHCTFFRCAMNESSSVSDAMSHPLFLCPVCLRKLQRACGFDVLERYQQLRQFLGNCVEQLDNASKIRESLAWLDKCIEYLQS